MSQSNVVTIPYPAQGHVIPLMVLSYELDKHGIKVTFVNTDFTHNQIMKALGDKGAVGDEIQLVSIPEGLKDRVSRNKFGKLTKSIFEVMPQKLEMLIEDINSSDSNTITSVVADENMGWALKVAKKMGIRLVAFWSALAPILVLTFNIQKLLDDRVIDSDREKFPLRIFHLLFDKQG